MENHIDLCRQGGWETSWFVAVVDKDWGAKGVLLVALRDDFGNNKTDFFRSRASDIGLTLANLQIANMGWDELKDYQGIELPSDDEINEEQEVQENSDSSESGPECPPGPPPLGYYIPLYVPQTVEAQKLIKDSLEPGARYKSDPSKDYVIRHQASLITSDNGYLHPTDMYRQACTLHLVRCRKNKHLHKTLLLVVDSDNPQTKGITLIRLHWDGVTRGRSKACLRKLGAGASTEMQSIPCSVEGIQNRYCNIANGVRIWRALHPLIAVFPFDGVGRKASILDPEARKRQDGDEWIIFAPQWITPEGEYKSIEVKWDFNESVNRFPWFRNNHRFDENFVKEYLVCLDSKKPEEDGVLIVKLPRHIGLGPSGSTNRREAERLEMREKLRGDMATLRVDAKDALGLIDKAWRADRDKNNGMSDEQRKFFGL
jgi:hypothetical protein